MRMVFCNECKHYHSEGCHAVYTPATTPPRAEPEAVREAAERIIQSRDNHDPRSHYWISGRGIRDAEAVAAALRSSPASRDAVSVPDNWQPTAEAINALPAPLRAYIHDLETNCDPAGIVRENQLVKDENAMLRRLLAGDAKAGG